MILVSLAHPSWRRIRQVSYVLGLSTIYVLAEFACHATSAVSQNPRTSAPIDNLYVRKDKALSRTPINADSHYKDTLLRLSRADKSNA